MNRNILVAYASKYGATKEIAEKVGEMLARADLQVAVSPVDTALDITPYDAVILGSAIYIGRWQKEAVEFLRVKEKILANRPVWIFSSGPTGDGDPVALVEGLRFPAELQPVIDRIHPRDITVFHGFINPGKINFIEKWSIKSLVKKPFGDFRDWDAITAWATSIAETLKNTDAEESTLFISR